MSQSLDNEHKARVAAFVETTAPYHRRLYGIALSLCRDADQASDLTQDALLRAFNAFDRFKPGSAPLPWLARILRNRFLDTVKSGRARYELAENQRSDLDEHYADGTAAGGADALDQLERARLSRLLREEIAGLAAPQRLVVTLCDIEGLSYEEAASVTGSPLGTVRSRLARARARLTERIRERVSGCRVPDDRGVAAAPSRAVADKTELMGDVARKQATKPHPVASPRGSAEVRQGAPARVSAKKSR